MPIIKCKDHIEVYERKARSGDLHELSGRTGRADLTQYVAQSIAATLPLRSGDLLVDIGCGDGTLIGLVADKVASVVGILPTAAEVGRVRPLFTSNERIEIRQGLSQQTGLPAAIADVVVCNGVFLLLSSSQVDQSFREIARIGKPGSTAFIGEVPRVDEFRDRTYGDSIGGWLWWVLRNQGLGAFATRLRQTLVAFLSSEPMMIGPKEYFFCEPAAFIALAQAHGLKLQTHFPHPEVATTGENMSSATRWDYVFVRD